MARNTNIVSVLKINWSFTYTYLSADKSFYIGCGNFTGVQNWPAKRGYIGWDDRIEVHNWPAKRGYTGWDYSIAVQNWPAKEGYIRCD